MDSNELQQKGRQFLSGLTGLNLMGNPASGSATEPSTETEPAPVPAKQVAQTADTQEILRQYQKKIAKAIEAQKALEAAVATLRDCSNEFAGSPAPVSEALAPTVKGLFKVNADLSAALLNLCFVMPPSFGAAQEGFEAQLEKATEHRNLSAQLPLMEGASSEFSPAVLAHGIVVLRNLGLETAIEEFFSRKEPKRHAKAIQGLVATGEIGLIEQFLLDTTPAKVAIGLVGFAALSDAQLASQLEPKVLALIDQPAHASSALQALATQGTEVALETLVNRRLSGGNADVDPTIVGIIDRLDSARVYFEGVLIRVPVDSLVNLRDVVAQLSEPEELLRSVFGARDAAYPRIKALGLETVFDSCYPTLRQEFQASDPAMLKVINQAWTQHIS